MGVVGLIAAMPEEVAPLLKRVGRYQRERVEGVRVYRFTLNDVPVVLVQSGMGPAHASAGAELLLVRFSPALVINFGYGGVVHAGPAAGDLVVAERFAWLEGDRLREVAAPRALLTEELFCQGCADAGRSLFRGTFLTAAKITSKEKVALLVGEEYPHPVLEMESAAIVEAAARAGVPVAAVRGVSDAADEELDFSLEEFCDRELNLRISKVLATVVSRPRIIPQLMRLARNSRLAGENLAACLERVIRRELLGKVRSP